MNRIGAGNRELTGHADGCFALATVEEAWGALSAPPTHLHPIPKNTNFSEKKKRNEYLKKKKGGKKKKKKKFNKLHRRIQRGGGKKKDFTRSEVGWNVIPPISARK